MGGEGGGGERWRRDRRMTWALKRERIRVQYLEINSSRIMNSLYFDSHLLAASDVRLTNFVRDEDLHHMGRNMGHAGRI